MINFRSAFVMMSLILVFPAEVMASKCEKPERLVFSKIIGNSAHRVGARILEQVYTQLGIDLEYRELPARRALQASVQGETDGEIFRIKNIESKYPNLHRTQVPLLTFRGFAYTKSGLKINRLDNLKDYRVGILRGIVWAEEGVKSPHIVPVESVDILLEKLLKGGIDVAVTIDFPFENEIRKKNVQSLMTRGSQLISFDVFHYLNKKYACLATDIDHHLKVLHDSGTIKRMAKTD